MSKLVPHLSFPGTAKEAMTFYQDIFGGELSSSTYADFQALPADHEHAGRIMHAQLVGDFATLMAADEVPGMSPGGAHGDNIALAFTGPEEDIFRTFFDKLSEGGKVEMPLEAQVWGDVYGSVIDRYGIRWMFNIENPDAQVRTAE